MAERLILGIDIGGTNIRMGTVDRDFRMTHFERRSSQEMLRENSVANLAKAIGIYMKENGLQNRIGAVAVGIPGAVDKDHNHVYAVPKVQGLSYQSIGDDLTAMLNVPSFVFHDVHLLTLYDILALNLDPERRRTILGFYVGTGFGNALYIDGELFYGKHGVAGELGHIPLYGVEDYCSCGDKGCVETRCCGQYLANLVKTDFPDCHISDIFTKYGDDPRIIKFVKDCALPIATEITLLDPDYVLLGGGVLTMTDFPLKMLEDEIVQRTHHKLPAEDIQFVYATDSIETGVVGAAIAAAGCLPD